MQDSSPGVVHGIGSGIPQNLFREAPEKTLGHAMWRQSDQSWGTVGRTKQQQHLAPDSISTCLFRLKGWGSTCWLSQNVVSPKSNEMFEMLSKFSEVGNHDPPPFLKTLWGAWVAQVVNPLPLDQVMISRAWDQTPHRAPCGVPCSVEHLLLSLLLLLPLFMLSLSVSLSNA